MRKANRLSRKQLREEQRRFPTVPPPSLPPFADAKPYDGTWSSVCAGNWIIITPDCDLQCECPPDDDGQLRKWMRFAEATLALRLGEYVEWFTDPERDRWLVGVYPDAATADRYGFHTERQTIRSVATGAIRGYSVNRDRPVVSLWELPFARARFYLEAHNEVTAAMFDFGRVITPFDTVANAAWSADIGGGK